MPEPSAVSRILREAIKAVPAVRYALGVAGVAAAVALVYSLRINPVIAVLGTVVMFLFMTVLVVFARLVSLSTGVLKLPAIILTWFSLLLLMTVSTLLVTCAFFRKPIDLSRVIDHGSPRDERKPDIYYVRVQVLDPQGNPVSDAKVLASAGNEPHLLPSGWWEIQVPSAKVPANGHITIWAEHKAWKGNSVSLDLDGDPNPSVEIPLGPPESVLRGCVVDGSGQGVADVRISLQDGAVATATTGVTGQFELRLPIAAETLVHLRADGAGHTVGDGFCYAGRDTCQIFMGKL